MKRKTNLFYLSGDDSKFISFSNYSESMTGNFLATDWKLFPSKFICMYVKYLDVEDEETFNTAKARLIRYLASYYENKLAFLRDYYNTNNLNVESNLLPLNYLLEALYRLPDNYYSDILPYDDIDPDNENVKISFIGDITEQDYNGTYTDIINFINSSDYAKGKIILNDDYSSNIIKYDDYITGEELDYLYGWFEKDTLNSDSTFGAYSGPTDYEDVSPFFDEDDYIYYINSKIYGISTDTRISENIKFNIIIPLYDLVNTNTDTNTTKIVEDEKIIINNVEQNGIDLTKTNTGYIINVPIGIWFAGDTIELKRNSETGYAPSWSLLLSSQIKPFPYSRKMPSEVSQNTTKEAFATYSQVLMRQNKLLDKLESMTEQLTQLSNRIDLFESKLNSIGTSYTVDKMHTEMINFEHYIENHLNGFKNEIYTYVTNNWKAYIS